MTRLYRSLPLLAVLALAASCSSDSRDSSSGSTKPAGGADTAVPDTSPGGDGSGESSAPLCLFASSDDLAALFPGATAGNPDPSSNSCTIAMTAAGGDAFFLMSPSLAPFDARMQQDTDLGLTISQLDGIGERSYYSRGNDLFPQADLVFEKAGTTYAVRASYANSDQSMIAEPTLQDTLMRIAATWAASI